MINWSQLGASFQLANFTFKIVFKNKKILLFSVLAAITSMFMVLMIFGGIYDINTHLHSKTITPKLIIGGLVVSYFFVALTSTFFNFCLIFMIKNLLDNKRVSVAEGLKYGLLKWPLVIGWGLISALIGFILRLLEGKSGRFSLTGMALGLSWTLFSMFVIPAMIYHNIGPFKAFKEIISRLKKTWGVGLIKTVGLDSIHALCHVIYLCTFYPIANYLIKTHQFFYLSILGVVAVLFFSSIFMFFNTASKVFNTALYHYADTGEVGMGYDLKLFKKAFLAN